MRTNISIVLLWALVMLGAHGIGNVARTDEPRLSLSSVLATTATAKADVSEARDAKGPSCFASTSIDQLLHHPFQLVNMVDPLGQRCEPSDTGCWKRKCCRTVGWPECCEK